MGRGGGKISLTKTRGLSGGGVGYLRKNIHYFAGQSWERFHTECIKLMVNTLNAHFWYFNWGIRLKITKVWLQMKEIFIYLRFLKSYQTERFFLVVYINKNRTNQESDLLNI